MNCATHSDSAAVAFCRTCGKPLCQNCTRDVRGVIYCEACLAARMEGVAPAAGFVPPAGVVPPAQTVIPPVGSPPGAPRAAISSGPNPAVAGILAGFFPFGVGAVYCSQYAKGFAHLVIMVLLIVGESSDVPWYMHTFLGIALGFFYVYQIIDSVRSAKAIQMGEPVPDPFGLAQTFGAGERLEASKIPVGSVILIGLGVLFLLHTMGIWEFGLDRFWPLLLILLGVGMFYRNWQRSACPCTRCRTRGLMGPTMVLLTGILFLLDTTRVAELDRTWPAWILAVGVVKLFRSTASSAGHIGPLPPATPSSPPPQNPPSEPQPPASGEVSNV